MISLFTRKVANAIYSYDLLVTGVAVIYEWAKENISRNNRVLSDDLVSSRKILKMDARCTFKTLAIACTTRPQDAEKDFLRVIDALSGTRWARMAKPRRHMQGEHELNNLGWFYFARLSNASSLRRSLRLWLDHPTLLTHVKNHVTSRSCDIRMKLK